MQARIPIALAITKVFFPKTIYRISQYVGATIVIIGASYVVKLFDAYFYCICYLLFIIFSTLALGRRGNLHDS
jgi:hypothetical protein